MKRKRIILLFSTGLLLVAGMAAFLFFQFARPVGSGPAGPQVAGEVFAQPWTSRPVLLVGLGDSVTAGFGARKGYGYFERLAQNPADEFPALKGISLAAVFPNLIITNLSVSGSTSSEVAGRQLTLLATNDANVRGLVVMTTGGNDLIHNYGRTAPREEAMYGATWEQAQPWVNNFAVRLEEIIAETRNRFPGGCDIFMANIYDPTDGIGDAENAGLPHWLEAMKILAAYNQVIENCAEKHPDVHLVDMHQAFLGHGIHCTHFWREHFDWHDPHYWFFANLEDPNERGYDVIRRLFLTKIGETKSTYIQSPEGISK
jgi:lysophospholipase L1-like esterase